jgi:hypothetical protein
VIGNSFDARDLAALVQARDVDDAIDRLVEEGLIEEERESRGGLLSFSSGVVHDVLYAGLSPRKRRSLHRRCAELLEARHAGRLERVLPQLVQHYFQGDVPDKTVEHALRLARTSLETFSVEDTTRSATTALTFLDADWEGPRVLEGDARLLLARASRWRATSRARAVKPPPPAASSNRKPISSASRARWCCAPRPRGRRAVGRHGAVARQGPGRRPQHPGHRQPAAPAVAGDHAFEPGGRIRAGQRAAGGSRTARHGCARCRRRGPDPHGGRLVVAQANQVNAIEPVATKIIEESEIGGTVYETLLATDTNGHLLPWLCEKWDLVDSRPAGASGAPAETVHFSVGALRPRAAVKSSIRVAVRNPRPTAARPPLRQSGLSRDLPMRGRPSTRDESCARRSRGGAAS